MEAYRTPEVYRFPAAREKMDLYAFLSHPAMQLPVTRGSEDFQSFVNKLLDTFMILYDQSEFIVEFENELRTARDAITEFCRAARRIIESVYSGQPADAYDQFAKGIAHVVFYLKQQAFHGLGWSDSRIMYRVRQCPDANLTREDLFHIPFEQRHKVNTQRYSIPGLPCLYLSGSVYTCWAEMGKPPFDSLRAAALWLAPDKKVSIIDFSMRPARLLRYFSQDRTVPDDRKVRRSLANHIVLWPLIALCSIVVKHRDSPFKPEYIIPQILLQWITKEHQFDGVCYFSMHVPAVVPGATLVPCNLVFPARTSYPNGRCTYLRELFRMSEPHPWEVLRAVHAGEGVLGAAPPGFDFEFLEGKPEPYYATEFGKIETTLNRIAHDVLAANQAGDLDAGMVRA